MNLTERRPFARTVTVTARRGLELQLNQAVGRAIEEALKSPEKGIRVTRHSHDRFTVELTAEVPFGITQELDLRSPSEVHGRRSTNFEGISDEKDNVLSAS
ncbi:hypothetical protein AB4Y87_10495 [Paenarthrobacter sp. RAF54_2]|uniref:hypothetical protein n=1 Tax=Paenarthrobacter sp. RAF54_2 TaxID=3233061 RepID=UPI003F9E45E4